MQAASSTVAAAAASTSYVVVHPTVDPLLRHLASYWTHRRHVHHFFTAQHRGRLELQETSVRTSSTFDGYQALSANNIQFEPLLVIIGLGVMLFLVDIAFGSMMRRPTAAKDASSTGAKARGGASSGETSVESTVPATPTTEEQLKEAADEWAYFRKTKCKVLLLSMVLGFASEFLLWMLAPFFPLEARVRGVETEIIGLVFACHPIALGVSSQIAPWLMRNVEPFVILQRTLLLQVHAPSHLP